MTRYAGGCVCGQVRWRAGGAPANVRICHCTLCQKAVGGPFFARAVFHIEDFVWTGEVTRWRTSARIERCSCARCGTSMASVPNDAPARIGVSLATLDDPDALAPECHIFVSTKRKWIALDDGLPQYLERPPA